MGVTVLWWRGGKNDGDVGVKRRYELFLSVYLGGNIHVIIEPTPCITAPEAWGTSEHAITNGDVNITQMKKRPQRTIYSHIRFDVVNLRSE